MNTYQQCIDGKLICGVDKVINVINPASELPIADIRESSLEQVNLAVSNALNVFSYWKKTSNEERIHTLRKIADVIAENKTELAELITKEQGKPLSLAMLEVDASIDWVNYTASLSLLPKVIEDSAERVVEQHYRPLGVVASITPWNWPVMIAIWHIIPAIKAGNTVVIKPSNYTPLSTLFLVELINRVIPPGVINSVVGEAVVGDVLSRHADISKIVFTGSTATGQKIMENASINLKRLTLELGGNDAAFVLADADVESLAPRIFQAAFLNMGQTCAAIKRLYVHESIYDTMCEKLCDIAKASKVGDGFDSEVTFGPVQNLAQLAIVEELVADAICQGGKVLCGGGRPAGSGFFYPPTLISGLSDGVRLVDEEQFGPVLPIIKFSDPHEAIAEANKNSNGLGSSVWSADTDYASSLVNRIEAGTTWINNHAEVLPNCPFGGCKMSGFGVEFGLDGLKEYTYTHIVNKAKA